MFFSPFFDFNVFSFFIKKYFLFFYNFVSFQCFCVFLLAFLSIFLKRFLTFGQVKSNARDGRSRQKRRHQPTSSAFPTNFTISLQVCSWELQDVTHHIPLPWQQCNFSLLSAILLLSAWASCPSQLLNSSFLHGLSSMPCTSESHCQCFVHSLLFSSPGFTIFLEFFQHLQTSSPCCRLRDPVQENPLLLQRWKSVV